jgi:hypothetical protein
MEQYIVESLDDETFQVALDENREVIREFLKKNPQPGPPDLATSQFVTLDLATAPLDTPDLATVHVITPEPEATHPVTSELATVQVITLELEAAQPPRGSGLIERHPYSHIKKIPKTAAQWRDLAEELGNITMYERRMQPPRQQALLLLRLILATGPLDVRGLAEVEEDWLDDLENGSDKVQKCRRDRIRERLHDIRRFLHHEFGMPDDSNPIPVFEVSRSKKGESGRCTSKWKLDWDLLDKFGYAANRAPQS